MQQEFIKCIQAYLKGEKLNKLEDDKDLITLAKEQSLETILYSVYDDASYEKYYSNWVKKQKEFIDIQNDLSRIFNENKINHIFFKGAVLASLYDDPNVRTRGDIDVYVDIDDLDKAKEVLKQNSYYYDDGDRNTFKIKFYKYTTRVELHFVLVDEIYSKDRMDYFKKPFEISKNISNCQYQLNDNEHFIYYLAHFAHELKYGASIRYIIDFYYMIKKTNINFHRLENDCKALKLDILYYNVLNAIFLLTGEEFVSFKEGDVDFFIDYMLKSKSTCINDKAAKSSDENKRYFGGKIFLTNKKYRKAMYPKLGSKAILYPLCLIKHWSFLISNRFKHLFGNNKKRFFKKLGI